jgi:hypothetical protein
LCVCAREIERDCPEARTLASTVRTSLDIFVEPPPRAPCDCRTVPDPCTRLCPQPESRTTAAGTERHRGARRSEYKMLMNVERVHQAIAAQVITSEHVSWERAREHAPIRTNVHTRTHTHIHSLTHARTHTHAHTCARALSTKNHHSACLRSTHLRCRVASLICRSSNHRSTHQPVENR